MLPKLSRLSPGFAWSANYLQFRCRLRISSFLTDDGSQAMPRILLVDDDFDLAETLKEWFEMDGHLVDAVQTGSAALANMASSSYDIIILDWQLPDGEGVDVCRQYRAQGGTDKVLMLTGKREFACQYAGLKAGANDFLSKPFTLDQLMERFESLLKDKTSPGD